MSVAQDPSKREAPAERQSAFDRTRDDWLLSLEGVVHAPSDVGFQAGLEVPARVRFFSGFGIIPADWLTGFVSKGVSDPTTRQVLELPSYSGSIWRAQVGYRPFKNVGLYLDGGYAHARLRGELGISGLLAQEVGFEGDYVVTSSIDLWLVELGYQWEIAHRGVLALGLGVESTFNANTRISATRGAPGSSDFARDADRANRALESYGKLPVLTLRLGLDLL